MGILSQPAIDTAVHWDEADLLSDLAKGKDVLELGCDYGFSAVVMGRVATHVDTVDSFGPIYGRGGYANHVSSELVARSHVKQYGVADRVTVHKGTFGEVVPRLRALRLRGWDMVFVDGVHEYEDVWRDAELARSVATRPALIAFHDYGRFGTATAVEEFIVRHDLKMREILRSLAVVEV